MNWLNEQQMDRHMHSKFSDGIATPEVMIESALQKGMTTVAITDHMPVPFKDDYAIPRQELDNYRARVQRLQAQYRDRLTVQLGMEFDYLPAYASWTEDIVELGWDWKIGSTHFFNETDAEGIPLVVDGNAENFARVLAKAFNGDVRAMVESYYARVRETVATGWFDVVGHLDVIKKTNVGDLFFNPSDAWYKKAVMETLEVIGAARVMLEINTAGLAKPVGEQYPSDWIVGECLRRDIPLCLNSDAHRPESIGQFFDQFRTLQSEVTQ